MQAGGSNIIIRRSKAPVPVGLAISALVQELGIAPILSQFDVITSWPEVVGEQIAHVTAVQRMENGILYVAVATAPWRAELSMKRRAIVEKLNSRLGAKVVKDIRFR